MIELSVVEKIGQLMFMGIRGTTVTQDEAEFIITNNIGGISLFARNVESPEQVHALCTQIQSLRHRTRDKLPLFIAMDQEGGRVARLKAPFTLWPPLAYIGKLDSTSVAFRFALAMGTELRSVGINLNFAPVVDVLTNPKNEVIGDRALSTDPEMVAKLASALVRGYIKSGIIPCAKHFPGHGNTLLDSHAELPVEDSTLEQLRSVALVPFKKVFRARLDMVMTSHIKFPKIDPEFPVTLSEKFIRGIARDELRFRNLIITDDLDMKALANHFPTAEIPVRAILAGCDLLLYCNEFDHPAIAMEALVKAARDHRISAKQIDESFNRVAALKREMLANPEPPPYDKATSLIGCPDHLRLALAIKEGAVPADLLVT